MGWLASSTSALRSHPQRSPHFSDRPPPLLLLPHPHPDLLPQLFYVLCRIAYVVLYLINTTPALAGLRSLVWLQCIGACAVLMLQAAAAGGKARSA